MQGAGNPGEHGRPGPRPGPKGKKSVLIVTDKGISGLGLLKPLTDALEQAGVSYAIYEDTVQNPTIHNVDRKSVV